MMKQKRSPMRRKLLIIHQLLLCLPLLAPAGAAPPDHHAAFLPVPPPISCINPADSTICKVEAYQHSWTDSKPCQASMATYPTSEAQLIQAVAYAAKTLSKVKVVSRGSHSISKLVCPGGSQGILISTRDYNSFIHVNRTARTVTADAGVMLRDLVDKIAEHGLTLPHAPFFEGVSVAGTISTGAHGSGMWGKGSAPHDYVVGIRLIVPATEEEGYAKVVDLTDGDEDLDAARLSLGVLGAISKVTFQLEPMFKRSSWFKRRGEEGLEDEILEFAYQYEFGYMHWFPTAREVLFKAEDRVHVDTEGNGAFKMASLAKVEVGDLREKTSAILKMAEKSDAKEICDLANRMPDIRYNTGGGLVNDIMEGTFTGYPVVGFNHNMQTSGTCEDESKKMDSSSVRVTATSVTSNSVTMDKGGHGYAPEDDFMPLDPKAHTCFWNPLINRVFVTNIAIAIPISHTKQAISEIKKLRDLYPASMCDFGLLGGFFIRFLSPSKAYLGEWTNSVLFEMLHFVNKDAPELPRPHVDIIEEIEQMLLFKFGGKPHWGKNRDIAFEDMRGCTRDMGKFLEARERLDPLGIFSSEWSDAMLGINTSSAEGRRVQIFQDHCALQGICICKEDSHCNPAKNSFCRKGHLYDQARVCRYEVQGASTADS